MSHSHADFQPTKEMIEALEYIRTSDTRSLKKLFDNPTIDENSRINPDVPTSMTLLFCAAQARKADVVEFLLREGADPNIPVEYVVPLADKDVQARIIENVTPLMAIAMNRDRDAQGNRKRIIESLIKHNADLTAVDSSGRTAMDWALIRNNLELVAILEEQLAKKKQQAGDFKAPDEKRVSRDGLKFLWSANKIKKSTGEDLHNAVGERDVGRVTWLLKNKVDPNNRATFILEKNDGKEQRINQITPLIRLTVEGSGAVSPERLAIINALLEAGADINAADAEGKTALHWAAIVGNKALAESLIYAGANQVLSDKTGKMPIDYASPPLRVLMRDMGRAMAQENEKDHSAVSDIKHDKPASPR